MWKVKRDQADKLFSDYIRKRDGQCMRCGRSDIRLECSHFWGRRMESVRFDPINADALCHTCHARWEHMKGVTRGEVEIDGKFRVVEVDQEYRAWKKNKIGLKAFEALEVRAHTRTRKDRAMEIIKLKELIKKL